MLGLLQVTVSSIRTKGVGLSVLFWLCFAFADRTHVGFGLADFPAVFFQLCHGPQMKAQVQISRVGQSTRFGLAYLATWSGQV